MQLQSSWKSGMKFEANADGKTALMDAKAPIGKGEAMTPKELVAAGLVGCTAMDVIALLKKHKQPVTALTVDADIETSTGQQPAVFTSALLTFRATGEISAEILLDAVHLSQTKYCGVRAMLSRVFPIRYTV